MGRPLKSHARSTMAQMERQSTEQITKSQSLTLVKNLVRISISTVCHIRNIFPTNCFQERSYAGLRIYQLDCARRDPATNETVVRDQQAYMLTQWLEEGVFQAVERRYLRRLEFIIVSPELDLPRESYSFDMDYPGEQDITFGGKKITMGNTRSQLVKLIRSLIQFSNTLDEVPNERYITMKLWYYDDRTPSDWEPRYFASADPSDLSFSRHGDHDHLRIRIGEVTTPYHSLKVRFQGIDSNEKVDEDEDNGKVDEQVGPEEGGHGEATGNKPRTTLRSMAGSLLNCEAGPDIEDGTRDLEGTGAGGCGVQEKSSSDQEHLRGGGGEGEGNEGEDEGDTRLLSSRIQGLSMSGGAQRQQRCENRPLNADEEEGREEREESGSSQAQEFIAAKDWVLSQKKPTLRGLMEMLDIPRDIARQHMDRMVEDGYLTKDASFHFKLTGKIEAARGKLGGDDTRESEGGPLGRGPDRSPRDSDDGANEDDAMDTGSGADAAGNLSQESSDAPSDDSATQLSAELEAQPLKIRGQGQCTSTPSSMPPPPALGGLRGPARELGVACEPGGVKYATPPVQNQHDLQQPPPAQKLPQPKILSMGTKRVLDTESDGISDPEGDLFAGMDHSAATVGSTALGYDVSLSQSSTIVPTAKCSLAEHPIRQTGRKKKLRLGDRRG